MPPKLVSDEAGLHNEFRHCLMSYRSLLENSHSVKLHRHPDPQILLLFSINIRPWPHGMSHMIAKNGVLILKHLTPNVYNHI